MYFQVDTRSSDGHKGEGREAAEIRQLPETEIKDSPILTKSKPKQVSNKFYDNANLSLSRIT